MAHRVAGGMGPSQHLTFCKLPLLIYFYNLRESAASCALSVVRPASCRRRLRSGAHWRVRQHIARTACPHRCPSASPKVRPGGRTPGWLWGHGVNKTYPASPRGSAGHALAWTRRHTRSVRTCRRAQTRQCKRSPARGVTLVPDGRRPPRTRVRGPIHSPAAGCVS